MNDIKEKTRTEYSIRNLEIGAIGQVVNIILNFIVRTIFVKTLNENYLGVNGLFTNILTILSFAELGIGSAIIYNMYKPIANNDKEKIKSLMHFYKITYRIIGLFILICGILIIPFLSDLIKEKPNIPENLTLIYLLFLSNTVLSYFWTYKKSIIIGVQKEYITNIYKIIFYLIRSILQILVLIIWKNFVLYLIIQVFCTFLENVCISFKADKMFPYLKDKDIREISGEEKKHIFKNVKALAIYKFGSVILNGTDNIIISMIIGISAVGILSNYTLIVSSVIAIVGTALSGITASIGNLNATSNKENKERIFYELFLIITWIYGLCSIGLIILINPFIELWLGSKYVMSFASVLALILHFYVNGVQFAGYSYRTTTGLFEKGKIAPIVAAIINVILSFILGKYMGVVGILLATSISRLLTTTWLDPYLVHKYEFKTSSLKFYKHYIINFIIVTINFMICYFITSFITENNILNFIFKGFIILIFANVNFFIAFHNSNEFKSIIQKLKSIFLKKYKLYKTN